MFRNKNRWMLLGLSLLMLLQVGCSKSDEKEVELVSEELIVPEDTNYKVTTVETGEYLNQRTTSGAVAFLITSDLNWDKADCRYQEVLVEQGAYVSKGDVLMRFSSEDSAVSLEEQQLNLTRMQEEFAVSKADRQKEIATAKGALDSLESYDYQIAQIRVNQLQSSYEQYCYEMEYQIAELQESIAEMQEEVDRTTITSPYDGVVEWVAGYTIGDKVPTGTTLISMYSTDKLAVRAENPGQAFSYNQEVTLTAGSGDNAVQCEGKVVSAGNILPMELQSEYMVIQLTSEMPEELNSIPINEVQGMSVSIAGYTEEIQNITIVNKNAVELEDGSYYVQIVEDGAVKKRFVTIGCTNNNGNGSIVWILDGIDEGDELVLIK